MSNAKATMIAALSGLIAIGTLSAAVRANASEKPEECCGVVKTGKNDC